MSSLSGRIVRTKCKSVFVYSYTSQFNGEMMMFLAIDHGSPGFDEARMTLVVDSQSLEAHYMWDGSSYPVLDKEDEETRHTLCLISVE